MNRDNKLNLLSLFILLLNLSACNASVTTPAATIIPASPTSTSQAPTLTSTPFIIIPSPLPTQPIIPVITPDPIQVERWKEYENALAKSVLPHLASEEALCEWDILGQSAREVYVWAVCRGIDGGGSVPAVIHLETDGSIQSVERAINWSADIPRLFPADVRGKFDRYPSGRAREMAEHVAWRRTHPEEPPLVVLSAAPLSKPTPTEWLPYNPDSSDSGCGEFTATLSITGTERISQEDLIKRLFEKSLAHYKSPEMGGGCRLEEYIIENTSLDERLVFLAKEQKVDYVGTVQYSVRIKEVPSGWAAGNGEIAPDGWILHKFLIVGVSTVDNLYILKPIGTGP